MTEPNNTTTASGHPLSRAISRLPANGHAIEEALVQGNLASLTPEQRVAYYLRVCESLGLNPHTSPFDYIAFQGKLRLYAKRDCTDQLRRLRGVNVTAMRRSVEADVLTVEVNVSDSEGRQDVEIGCVNIAGLKGDALANAMMKALTKAKRRATLSICGLGWLDETELETIPDARPEPTPRATVNLPAPAPSTTPTQGKADLLTPLQANRLDELADQLSLSPASAGRWLQKNYGVVLVSALTADDAAKAIGRLEIELASRQQRGPSE